MSLLERSFHSTCIGAGVDITATAILCTINKTKFWREFTAETHFSHVIPKPGSETDGIGEYPFGDAKETCRCTFLNEMLPFLEAPLILSPNSAIHRETWTK